MNYEEIKQCIVNATTRITENTEVLTEAVQGLNRIEDELTPEGKNILVWLLSYAKEQGLVSYKYQHIIKEFEDE